MGICCSKTNPKISTPTTKSDPSIVKKINPDLKICLTPKDKSTTKEKPIINHCKSMEVDSHSVEVIEKVDQNPISGDRNLVSEISSDLGTNCTRDSNLINNGSAVVRTSSCTRDEVEAILIKCGRLSRSSSAVQTPVSGHKYSGSKRSFDFDQEVENADVATDRESRRQSRPSSNRRRTPSTEREREKEQNHRSGSRERHNNGGGRRVSRSPGRMPVSPIANPSAVVVNRPGQMVSVPATVSSLAMDKSNVKIAVKRNSTAASPRRSRSPAARANSKISNDNQNKPQGGGPLSLSRSNSRKADQSPYRRNPLREIDQNSQKQGLENVKMNRTKTNEPPQADENAKAPSQMTNNVEVNFVVVSGPEPHKPQALTRTRSSRQSRDLETLNLEPQNQSPPSSYTALLIEDIQNFHNKTPITNLFPQCLSTACSIVDEIAGLNSNNGPTWENYAKKLLESKEPPLVETEVVAMNDLIERSFQKYVTVKRGNVGREEEESSGSNSFTCGPQHWISSSLWETNSNDSTDCCASSSRSTTKDDDRKKRGFDCTKMGIRQANQSNPVITTATI